MVPLRRRPARTGHDDLSDVFGAPSPTGLHLARRHDTEGVGTVSHLDWTHDANPMRVT